MGLKAHKDEMQWTIHLQKNMGDAWHDLDRDDVQTHGTTVGQALNVPFERFPFISDLHWKQVLNMHC